MTRIESKKVDVPCSNEDCFTFLTDLNNYQLLLPKEKVSDWKSDENSCSFKIQKTYKLELILESTTEYSTVNLKSGENSPFAFTLAISIEGGDASNVQLICDADINPFLKMMVEKPLSNLFDYMADRLVKVKSEAKA